MTQSHFRHISTSSKVLVLWLYALSQFAGAPALWAWGETGHRIVGRLAAAGIDSPQLRSKILALLDADEDPTCRQTDFAERLACVSMWADTVKRTTRKDTPNWHFVDIPVEQDAFDAQRDCKPLAGGDCVLHALKREIWRLQSPLTSTTPKSRAEAVKFIVHLIGDLHQPLHCVDDRDAGGNAKLVTWFGVSKNQFGHWNLHGVWDDGLIDKSNTPAPAAGDAKDIAYTKALQALLSKLSNEAVGDLRSGTLLDWAEEAHFLAQVQAYGTLPRQEPASGSETEPFYKLDTAYETDNVGTVDIQLLRAGVRLARILNEAVRGLN